MPLANWIKCTDGDIRHVRKKVIEGSKETKKDAERWAEVYNGYIIKFGLSKLYLKLLNTMKKKALLELKYVKTRERFKLTEIEIEEEKLKVLLNNNNAGITIEQSLIHLSKWVGYQVSPHKITVIEYFNLLNEYGKANKT